MSSKNPLTSSGVGGSPVRSKARRRMRVLRFASDDGCIPFASSFARTNRSIGFFGQLAFLTLGNSGLVTETKDQCPSHLAPCSIHFFRMAISVADNSFLLSGGGITSSASSSFTRCQSSLAFRSPATIARMPSRSANADSCLSNLSFAFLDFSEGP